MTITMTMIILISLFFIIAAYQIGVQVERGKWKYEEHRIYRGVPMQLKRDRNGNYVWEVF
jgi:hypothetical protein